MASSLFNISTYSRFNLSESQSDIQIFLREFGYRIKKQLAREEEGGRSIFASFAEKKLSLTDITWIQANQERFIDDTPNQNLLSLNYLSETGFITSIIYSPDGEFLIVGHSTGLIQEQKEILSEYVNNIVYYYKNEKFPNIWYPMFYQGAAEERNRFAWIKENDEKFLNNTRNEILFNRWYCSELGAITALTYSPNGGHIVVGHASGMIQMRHGSTGVVLCTLRNIQFPPKPVHALQYSRVEDRVCYAACSDGAVYRIEIPNINTSTEDTPEYCISADPALECLNTQFYGAPGISTSSTPFITQRFPALSLGITADQTKIIVGHADTSIKVYDMETQEAELTYKVHKLRLQFIPKKLQRMHFGQVCALRCHDQKPYVFASGAWDNTLRIWDVRCPVGCVMTFEGVNICGDSIDLNRDHCIAGSWQPTEALTVWDLVAKKRSHIVRVQNRRPDVDGEYIYTCRYWKSKQFNRKGKYAIIGGSGTNCVEVINIHNRYITCSYPAAGTVLAVTSHADKIAFGGTAPVLNIVSFHDPKHEKYKSKEVSEYDFNLKDLTWFEETERSSMQVVEQPSEFKATSTVSQGLSTTSQALSQTSQALSRTSQAFSRASQPVSRISQGASSTNRPAT